MPAGLGTLFAGLLLIVLAFVEGSSVWKALHEVLFGLFGCGSFVLGAAICYLAILYTRGEDLIGQMFKLMLGLVFASGTVIVFSEIPADIPAARMVAECYQNGVHAWLGGGAIGALLGGNLLLLCGRPAANLVMVVLALCASLYIFDITPAELWQWICELGGSAHEKGVAVYEQNAARRAERQAARQAEEEAAALEAGDELTEALVKKYLIDFQTAEKLKTVSARRKSVTYKDIMGISHKITPEEIYQTTEEVKEGISKKIADKIIELNGGTSVSAVFVVGGGGKLPGFTDTLAEDLDLPAERVALRGEEVMNTIDFQVEGIKKDPLYVTPIGICLNFFDQKNNFIFVTCEAV